MNKPIAWTANLLITTMFTMIAIFVIKKVSIKYDVPFLKTVSQAV